MQFEPHRNNMEERICGKARELLLSVGPVLEAFVYLFGFD
jgi:hypothetical protein